MREGTEMKNGSVMRRFRKERNEAITAAVMEDKWDKMYAYVRKYGVPMPIHEIAFKAGTYKAAHDIPALPQEVRDTADRKAIALGFKTGTGG